MRPRDGETNTKTKMEDEADKQGTMPGHRASSESTGSQAHRPDCSVHHHLRPWFSSSSSIFVCHSSSLNPATADSLQPPAPRGMLRAPLHRSLQCEGKGRP